MHYKKCCETDKVPLSNRWSRMETQGQLHAPAALYPQKETLTPNRIEDCVALTAGKRITCPSRCQPLYSAISSTTYK